MLRYIVGVVIMLLACFVGRWQNPQMAYMSLRLRVALAMVFMAFTFGNVQWQEAYEAVRRDKEFKGILPEQEMTKSQIRQAQRLGKKFQDTGSVHNKPKQTNKMPSITPDEAKLAAFLLKSGWTEWKTQGRHRYQQHNYFSSLEEALGQSPQLRSIFDKFTGGGTNQDHPKHRRRFMEELYKHDNLLRVRRRHMKYAYDEELMQKRQTRAKSLLTRSRREPDFLKRVFFVDECAIVFDHEIRKGVHVYCDAHDKGYRFVIPFKKAKPSQKIKVRILAAVNYHTGAFFLEFMTGTTNLENPLWNVGDEPGQRKYQVRMLACYLWQRRTVPQSCF
jgi:hypothetical protein